MNMLKTGSICGSSGVTGCRRLLSAKFSTTQIKSDKLRIGLIPSDGIGQEVVPAAKYVLDHINAPIEWVPLQAGFECFKKTGSALPQETVSELLKCHGALFGAVSSPSYKVEGYSSPIVALRKKLDLFANVRPVISSPVEGSKDNVDCVIVRENTECLYVKKERIEKIGGRKVAIAERHISEDASHRIGKFAFELARSRKLSNKNSKGLVTIVHKSNVLSITDGLFRETVLEIAKDYPDIEVEEQLVDSCVYRFVVNPETFDVVVAPNMYGDIVSDGAAGVVGGLGIVPSANCGDSFVLAEPVHGSAPDIAGQGIANPIATIRAAGLLLSNLGYGELNTAIEKAIRMAFYENIKTQDLKGHASTMKVAKSVAEKASQILCGSNTAHGDVEVCRDYISSN
eukprot:Nk52_evm9s2356 gene=Nk52_evmTU9s2356